MFLASWKIVRTCNEIKRQGVSSHVTYELWKKYRDMMQSFYLAIPNMDFMTYFWVLSYVYMNDSAFLWLRIKCWCVIRADGTFIHWWSIWYVWSCCVFTFILHSYFALSIFIPYVFCHIFNIVDSRLFELGELEFLINSN